MSHSDDRRAESPSDETQELLTTLERTGAPDLATLTVEQARALLGERYTPDVAPELVESVTEWKTPSVRS